MRIRSRPLVVLAALCLVATGCGDDDTAATSTTTSTSSTTSSTTTTTSTTPTTETATTETTAATSCAGASLPAAAADTVSVPADLDGDGSDDTVTSYRVGPASDPEWRLYAQLTSGGGSDRALPAPSGPSDERALGASDADENGTDEIWVKVGAGASAEIVSLFVLDGCDLVQVTRDGGSSAEFPVGGSVGSTGGVYCADEEGDGVRDVVVSSSSNVGGSDYETKIEVYHLVGSDLQFQFADAGSVDATSSDFARFTRLDCDAAQL